MNTPDLNCDTWQDILIKKGFDTQSAKALVAFISWNKGDEFAKLGREITEVLSDYDGKIFAKDCISTSYEDRALMFFSKDISEEDASKMFDTIMGYEQNEVYSSREVTNAFYNS